MMLVGFLGCCGACMESQALLVLVSFRLKVIWSVGKGSEIF